MVRGPRRQTSVRSLWPAPLAQKRQQQGNDHPITRPTSALFDVDQRREIEDPKPQPFCVDHHGSRLQVFETSSVVQTAQDVQRTKIGHQLELTAPSQGGRTGLDAPTRRITHQRSMSS